MIPELRLGVVVLTNQESGAAFNAITYRVLDHYLGAQVPDYVGDLPAAARRRHRGAARSAAAEARGAARDSTSGPSLPLGAYAGTYRDPWYGDVTIAQESGGLVIRFTQTPSLVGDLVHWQHDTFVARWRDRELRADAYVTFALNPDGTDRSGEDGADLAGAWTSASTSRTCCSAPSRHPARPPRTERWLRVGGHSPMRQPLRSYDAAE